MKARVAVALWLVGLLVCAVLAWRATYSADLSVFLPRAPTPEQRLLVEQIKSGVASRMLLAGIEGADAGTRARLSRELAGRLRTDARFAQVANGEDARLGHGRELLFAHRYLLSPAVDAERFGVAGLRAALIDSLDLLASSAGLLAKALLPRDPTGEMLAILDALGGGARPALRDGVWVSKDGERALLVLRTWADGSDTDAQEQAMAAVRAAFEQARHEDTAAEPARLLLSGHATFAVQARATIKREVTRLSALGLGCIVLLLGLVYRSPLALTLGLVPVLTGALAGVAVLSLGFGVVHGVTLGFGTALIGEAVDYAIYLLMLRGRGGAMQGFWPTIRIGVLTSVCGFAALLFSGLPGLAQLGLYAIAGLAAAALTTRFVLPHLLPPSLRLGDTAALGTRLSLALSKAYRLRRLLAVLLAASCVVLAARHATLWNRELSALSPAPPADRQIDTRLRADLGAPDAAHLVVAEGRDPEAALRGAERAEAILRPLAEAGVIGGFESPTRYLPSKARQNERQATLPDEATLRRDFAAAVAGLPLRAASFEPFFAEVARARAQPPLTRDKLAGTALAQGLDALLARQGEGWAALLPLRAPDSGVIDAPRVRAAFAAADVADLHYLDLKQEADRLYAGYLAEAIALSFAGLGAIVALLWALRRSWVSVMRLLAPLVSAVLVVMAGLALFGPPLTLLHLVGLLLVVAVGSNYALFLDGSEVGPATLAALTVANATTVVGFGVLAFSSVPVLSALGTTVGPGALLALLFSAILARRPVTR